MRRLLGLLEIIVSGGFAEDVNRAFMPLLTVNRQGPPQLWEPGSLAAWVRPDAHAVTPRIVGTAMPRGNFMTGLLKCLFRVLEIDLEVGQDAVGVAAMMQGRELHALVVVLADVVHGDLHVLDGPPIKAQRETADTV